MPPSTSARPYDEARLPDTCRRCRRPIDYLNGLWWSDDDFLCPDGDHQHAPVQPAQPRHHPAGGFYMRRVNGGTLLRARARMALHEIEVARGDGVRVENTDEGGITLHYSDIRGLVELRPATAEEASEPKIPDEEVYAPGSEVAVRPVQWDGLQRAHQVEGEFAGTVLYALNDGTYKVRGKEGQLCTYPLGMLRPAGRTRRPVEKAKAGAHEVWNTGAHVGGLDGSRAALYECADCRQRGPRADFTSLTCTPPAETSHSVRTAGDLLPQAFSHWAHRADTPSGPARAVFDRGVSIEVVAAELRAGAVAAWEESGLTLRRPDCTTVLVPDHDPAVQLAERAGRSAAWARWQAVLADAEVVAYEGLGVGDVLVRGYGADRRVEVMADPQDVTDHFGRRVRRLRCRSVADGHAVEVEYRPGEQVVRQQFVPRPTAAVHRAGAVLADGQSDRCAGCGHPIVWEFDDPDPFSDNACGWWRDDDGCDLCPATDENDADQQHNPSQKVVVADFDEQLAATIDDIAHSQAEAELAGLVRRAAALFAALDGHDFVATVPEAFAATMAAAAAATQVPTLADLARRAQLLWQNPASVEELACAFVACLPEHADHPAVAAASAIAREAGIPLAVIRHDWRDAYGEHGAQGLYLSPRGERGVECSWFIDGRDSERCRPRGRVAADRAARNDALMLVHQALVSVGWGTWGKESMRTHTRRVLSLLTVLPR
ncbi:hypothetical protein [Streptomyces sp. NPDC093589]|uniref:hypothetical protein n=1 Tax=Streptomyces sp. NPDC093589 TaxID=3366043 RepID=UPI00381DF76D